MAAETSRANCDKSGVVLGATDSVSFLARGASRALPKENTAGELELPCAERELRGTRGGISMVRVELDCAAFGNGKDEFACAAFGNDTVFVKEGRDASRCNGPEPCIGRVCSGDSIPAAMGGRELGAGGNALSGSAGMLMLARGSMVGFEAFTTAFVPMVGRTEGFDGGALIGRGGGTRFDDSLLTAETGFSWTGIGLRKGRAGLRLLSGSA